MDSPPSLSVRSPTFSHLSSTIDGISVIRAIGKEQQFLSDAMNLMDNHSSAWFLLVSTLRCLGAYVALISTGFMMISIIILMITFTKGRIKIFQFDTIYWFQIYGWSLFSQFILFLNQIRFRCTTEIPMLLAIKNKEVILQWICIDFCRKHVFGLNGSSLYLPCKNNWVLPILHPGSIGGRDYCE